MKTATRNILHDPLARHMQPEFTALRADQTVGEALAKLRGTQLAEKIVYFYVVDADSKLVGVVPTRRLLASELSTRIESLMNTLVVAAPRTATVLHACELFDRYRYLAFPVVDDEQRLVGVIDISLFADELTDLAQKRARDNVFQLIGVHLALGQKVNPFQGYARRFPWLIANLIGGLLCAFVAALHEAFLDQVIVLALFIPIVLALAESVSIQSTTLTLQRLHASRPGGLATSLGNELLTALLMGASAGTAVGVVAYVWKKEAAVSLVIGATITLAILTSCFMGLALPTLVHRLKADPKIAAGPIVLAAVDVATLLTYFNLAALVLGNEPAD